ncbi:MAG: T9SS type A sorting domain-containing protein [Bacteroidia bacterium]|nr:T9SS type A sorting domain-containing protein [Bacteroidia bacterium]
MKQIYITLAGITLAATSQAQYGIGRYASKVFANNIDSSINVVYGSAKSYTGTTVSLKMDVMQPHADSIAKRPLVIWVHGGSFISGSKTDEAPITRDFAQKGYVTANINYRLGVSPFDSIGAFKAAVRATQDLKAAIRFFYKDARTTNVYKIDTNKIFIGGSSAGAITSMHVAYLKQACKIEAFVGGSSALTALGGLEGISGNPGYPTRVAGVLNMCGALLRYDFIKQSDVPLCSMHGTNDGTVAYGRAPVNPGIKLLYLDGSRLLKQHTDVINHDHDFYTWYGAGHVPYSNGGAYLDTLLKFTTGFLLKHVTGNAVTIVPAPNSYVGLQQLYTYTTNCPSTSVENITENNVSIYPNPATNLVTITSETLINEVVLYNITGSVIISEKINGIKAIINRNELAAGTYILKIVKGNDVITKKIIFN